MTKRDIASLLARMNSDGRAPGGVTPVVCEIAGESEEHRRLVNAVTGYECWTKRDDAGGYTGKGRFATLDDLPAILERMASVGEAA